MSHLRIQCPILLVNPDPQEAIFLRDRLAALGILRRIVIFRTVAEAKDYFEAVVISGAPTNNPYKPCVVLLDEKLGESEVRMLAEWIRRQPELVSVRVVTLTSSAPTAAVYPRRHWGAHETVSVGEQLQLLMNVLARECRS